MARLSRRSLLRSTFLAAAALLAPSILLGPSAVHAALDDPNWNPTLIGRPGYGTVPVWSDEFEGASLDTSKWTAEEKAWPDNGELQYYTADEANCNTKDGALHIVATHTSKGGRDYTSARIDTHNNMEFKHGLFAARIKFTKGQGLWPAFWMFGTGPKYSEIDIAESAGGTAARNSPPTGSGDDTAYGTLLHFSVKDRPTDEVTKLPGGSFHTPDGTAFADGYYVMWLEWTGTEVWAGLGDDYRKIVDDISQLDAYNAYMYLILNVAVGGYYPGAPDAGTQLPQTMSVDWVRVWNKDGEDILKPVGTTTTPDASTGTDSTQQPGASSGGDDGTVTAGGGSTSSGGGGAVGGGSSASTPPPSGTSTGSSGTKPPLPPPKPDTTDSLTGRNGAASAAAGVGGFALTAAVGLVAGWMARMM